MDRVTVIITPSLTLRAQQLPGMGDLRPRPPRAGSAGGFLDEVQHYVADNPWRRSPADLTWLDRLPDF